MTLTIRPARVSTILLFAVLCLYPTSGSAGSSAGDARLGKRSAREWAAELGRSDREGRLAAIGELARHGSAAVRVLRLMVEQDGSVRLATRIAREIGPDIVPSLKSLAGRPHSPRLRLFASGSWAEISPDSEEASKALASLLQIRTIGWEAARILGRLRPHGWTQLVANLESGNPVTLLNSLHGLQISLAISESVPDSVVRLVKTTAPSHAEMQSRPAIRAGAIRVLGRFSDRGSRVVPLLVEALQSDTHAQVRAAAAAALGRFPMPVDGPACAALTEALDPEITGKAVGTDAGRQEDVLVAALGALSCPGRVGASTETRVRALLRHSSRRVRLAASNAVLTRDPKRRDARGVCLIDLRKAVNALAVAPPDFQRQHCAFAIRAIGTLERTQVSHPEAIDAIVLSLEAGLALPDPTLCLTAMRALRELEGSTFATRPETQRMRLRTDTAPTLLVSTHALAGRHEKLAAALGDGANLPTVDAHFVLDYLESLDRVPSVFAAPLIALLRRPDSRSRAATLLHGMGPSAFEGIQQLVELLRVGWTEERVLSARVLGGLLHAGARGAREHLQRAQSDRRRCVRVEAAAALRDPGDDGADD